MQNMKTKTKKKTRSKIFISYRQDDTKALTARLYDRLTGLFYGIFYGRFCKRNVFMDVASLPPAKNYQTSIEDSIAVCDVAVVVIGASWFGASDSTGKHRIHDVQDMVRREVELAMSNGLTLLPVRAEDAPIPSEQILPPSLLPLVHTQALTLSSAPKHFGSDMREIITTLKKYVNPCIPRYPLVLLGAVLALLCVVTAWFLASSTTNLPGRFTLANEAALVGFVISLPFWIAALVASAQRRQWLWFVGMLVSGALSYAVAYVFGGYFYFLPAVAPLLFGLLGSTWDRALDQRRASATPIPPMKPIVS